MRDAKLRRLQIPGRDQEILFKALGWKGSGEMPAKGIDVCLHCGGWVVPETGHV